MEELAGKVTGRLSIGGQVFKREDVVLVRFSPRVSVVLPSPVGHSTQLFCLMPLRATTYCPIIGIGLQLSSDFRWQSSVFQHRCCKYKHGI